MTSVESDTTADSIVKKPVISNDHGPDGDAAPASNGNGNDNGDAEHTVTAEEVQTSPKPKQLEQKVASEEPVQPPSSAEDDTEEAAKSDEEEESASKPDQDESTGDTAGASTGNDEEETMDEESPQGADAAAVSPGKTGRRERKKVERFEQQTNVRQKRTSAPGPGEGRGVKLEDCPVIMHHITKDKPDDIHVLHQIVFGRPGRSHEFRRNLRQFNGFTFAKDSPEYARKLENIARYLLNVLRSLVAILDIDKSATKGGSRDEIVEAILDFLMEPRSSGREYTPGKKRSKSRSSKGKARTPGKRKSGDKKGKDSSKEAAESNTDESDSDDEASEPEEKPKSPPKKKTPAKRTPSKKASSSASSTKKTPQRKRKSDGANDASSDDDVPLKKKAKKAPTDGELRSVVKKLLEGANLEEVTMKNILTQVYGKYPDQDLTGRKDFIKTVVKSLIS